MTPTKADAAGTGQAFSRQFPEDWPAVPFWSVYRRVKRASTGKEELLSVYRDHGVVRKSDRDDNFNQASEDLSLYQLVHSGDLVINKMKAWQGSVAVSPLDGIVSPAYFVFERASSSEPRFMHYLLRSAPFIAAYRASSKGIRPNQWDLDPDVLRTFPLCLPPLDVQGKIGDFLDRETGEIDAFIRDQEELIGLLQERRAATIKRAVTEGIHASRNGDEAGAPRGWISAPLKRFCRSLDSRRIPLSAEERSFRQGSYPYYGASGVIDNVDDYLFEGPRVLVSEDGANLLLRNKPIAFVAEGRYWVNNHAHILLPTDAACRFWANRIESVDVSPWVTGAAQPKLTIEALMNLPVSAPGDPNEVARIEAHIADISSQLDASLDDARRAIALSRERRLALISAAVTGKIDVREHVGV